MTIFLIFTLGTIWGSFFGLMIDRLPEHSIVHPRSGSVAKFENQTRPL